MDTAEVTKQILGAWEEVQAEEQAATETPEPEEGEGTEVPEPEETEPEETESDEDEEGDEDEDEADESDESDEGDEEAEVVAETPTEIEAYLAKYNGDTDAALRGAVELQKALGRQGLELGRERSELQARVDELETQLVQARAFASAGFLTEEQAVWVEEAANSVNPAVYVRGAIDAKEFELARAVCREWARENPYEATRAGQVVDAIEYQEMQAQSAPAVAANEPVDTQRLLNALADNYPDMRAYEPQMVEWFNRLGPDHPFVIDSRSTDVATAAKAIVSIYELARSAAVTDQANRREVKRRHRQQADDVRERAVVSSGSNSPSATETPRPKKIGPGLTLDALEAEFARQ